MAGSLLDSLCDAFDEDCHSDDGKGKDPKKDLFGKAFPDKEVPSYKGNQEVRGLPSLSQAAEYMMRAMQVTDPTEPDEPILPNKTPSTSAANSTMGPDEQLEYYRRMVQMQEFDDDDSLMGFFGEADSSAGDADSVSGNRSLQVCAEFSQSGDCKAGINCGFVHEGAFRRGGGKGYLNVDPEDFFRRALVLRSTARKLNKWDKFDKYVEPPPTNKDKNIDKVTDPGGRGSERVSVPVPDRWIPSLGSW